VECCPPPMSRRDSAIVAWHEVPGTEPLDAEGVQELQELQESEKHQRFLRDRCPEALAPFVVVLKSRIKTQENYNDKRSKHHPTSPCAPVDAGEKFIGRSSMRTRWPSGFPRMDSPARSITWRQSRRHLQNVVH